MLFWDVLFADVPGAFETPYQSAPLDIAEDCFYHAREGLIKDRLTEIEQGKARKILEKTDDEHRPSGTWCVGVRWDMFEKQDLLEIVDVSYSITISDRNYADHINKVPGWNVVIDHLSFVLRGLRAPWSRGSRSDHLEHAEGGVQVCRGKGARRFFTRESKGKSSRVRVRVNIDILVVDLDRFTSSGRSRS